MVVVIRVKDLKIEIRLKEEGHNKWHCHCEFSSASLSITLDDEPYLLACSKGVTKKQIRIAVSQVQRNLDELRDKWKEYHG